MAGLCTLEEVFGGHLEFVRKLELKCRRSSRRRLGHGSSLAGEADQRDVVKLGAIGDVALNRLHDLFAGGGRTRLGLSGVDSRNEAVAQAVAVGIHRVGDAVGVKDDRLSGLEHGLGASRRRSRA